MLLGQGAFGMVTKIEMNEKECARKRMPLLKDEGPDPSVVRECTILNSLRHPNIIRAQQVQVSENFVDIFMPLGTEDLWEFLMRTSDYVQRYALAWPTLFAISSALACMHEANFLHRDVKPSNILLLRKQKHNSIVSNIWLIDFGASRVCRVARANSILMTPGMVTFAYRAPEMTNEQYTSKSDIYSLGCSIVNLLTGTYPKLHGEKNIAPHPDDWLNLLNTIHISDNWRHLLISMLSYDPSKRPSAHQVLKQLNGRHKKYKIYKTVPFKSKALANKEVMCKEIIESLTWLAQSYESYPITLYVAMHLFERVLNVNCGIDPINVALACFRLSVKYLETCPVAIDDLLYSMRYPCTKEELATLETKVFQQCGYCVWRGKLPIEYFTSFADTKRIILDEMFGKV